MKPTVLLSKFEPMIKWPTNQPVKHRPKSMAMFLQPSGVNLKPADKKYVQSPEREDLIFGNHPNEVIYEKFTYDYMIDKLKNWINEIHN